MIMDEVYLLLENFPNGKYHQFIFRPHELIFIQKGAQTRRLMTMKSQKENIYFSFSVVLAILVENDLYVKDITHWMNPDLPFLLTIFFSPFDP